MQSPFFPNLGLGVGIRHAHFDHFLNFKSSVVQWGEVITENFIPWRDGTLVHSTSVLEKMRQNLPIALHGVSLSVGSADPVNFDYLKRVKELARRVVPAWVSDHLCWTGVHGSHMHDLLPLPYTEEALKQVVGKVRQVQDFLGRQILLENVSSYVEFSSSQMKEYEFLVEVAEQADCGILLDVNNVYVSSRNHGFDPYEYLKAIPVERVGQIHLAGHTDTGTHLIDTHDAQVCDAVWGLYTWVSEHFPSVSAMIEWDDKIPAWHELEREVEKIASHNILPRSMAGDSRRPSAAFY